MLTTTTKNSLQINYTHNYNILSMIIQKLRNFHKDHRINIIIIENQHKIKIILKIENQQKKLILRLKINKNKNYIQSRRIIQRD